MRCAAVLFFATVLAWPQAFEVASIKPSGPQSGNREAGGPGTPDPGRYRYTTATLEDLIVVAYDIEYYQVVSKAKIDRDVFDVVAKVPEGATKAQFRIMLQNLLADRFHLKFHREVRDFSGYELVVAKSGPKLTPSIADAPPRAAADDEFPGLPPGKPGLMNAQVRRNGYYLVRVQGRQKTMADLATALNVPGHGPIVDKTGLTGKYDFTLEYQLPGSAAPDG